MEDSSIIQIDPEECYDVDASSSVLHIITGICFILLSILQGSYGFKITQLDKTQYDRFFAITPNVLNIVNTILVISFFTRGLYQFISVYSQYSFPSIPIEGSDDVDFIIVIIFLLWDYIPTTLLIVTVTSRHLGTKPREGGLIRGLGVAFINAPLPTYGSIDKSGTTPFMAADDDADIEAHSVHRSSRRSSAAISVGKPLLPPPVPHTMSDNTAVGQSGNPILSTSASKRAAKLEMIDLRGLERFDAPALHSPQGSWLGDLPSAGVDASVKSRDDSFTGSVHTSTVGTATAIIIHKLLPFVIRENH